MVRTFGRGERRNESVAVDGATERWRSDGAFGLGKRGVFIVRVSIRQRRACREAKRGVFVSLMVSVGV